MTRPVFASIALPARITESGLQRITTWEPAFDRRAPEPSKNYGIHGVTCNWILKGPKGGLIWGLFTNWHLPHVTAEFHLQTQRVDVDEIGLKVRYQPMGAAIEYHALHRVDSSQTRRDGCLLVPGGVCYSDVAYTAGSDLMKVLIEQGGDAVWSELERRYHELPDEDVEPEGSS